MKNFKKLIVTLLFVFAMTAMIKVPAKASSYLWQYANTQNSISVEINRSVFKGTVQGLYFNVNGKNYSVKSADLNKSKFIIDKLPDNYAGTCKMYYYYDDNTTATWASSTTVNTVPTNVNGANCRVFSSEDGTSLRIGVPKPSSTMTGAIVDVYKNNQLFQTFEATGSDNTYFYTDYMCLTKNTVYKYRVRYFYYNKSVNKTYYSPAYIERQLVVPSVTVNAKKSKKGFSMKLKRTPGVTKYVVQVSSNDATGFKNAKTVKLSKKKKTYKFQVTKKYKKKKTNFIRVYTYIKGYGYSDYVWSGFLYVYK